MRFSIAEPETHDEVERLPGSGRLLGPPCCHQEKCFSLSWTASKERAAASVFEGRAPHRSSCSRHARKERRPSTEIRQGVHLQPRVCESSLAFFPQPALVGDRDPPAGRMENYKPHLRLTRGSFTDKGGENEALGRSRGGLSTKIHMTTDALGRPVRFLLTAGQTNDAKEAERLLEGVQTGYVIADKGYDTERVLQKVKELGAVAVIPPRSNRKVKREYDRELYKERNLIERAFNKLKRFRRIATRYDRKAFYFKSFLYLAASLMWI